MTATVVGSIAGRTTSFVPLHRAGNTSPVVFEATVTVPVSFDDLTAALWTWLAGVELAELNTDPAGQGGVCSLVLGALVCDNVGVADALAEIDSIRPGTEDYDFLCDVRAVISATFGLPISPDSPPAGRRECVRVGG